MQHSKVAQKEAVFEMLQRRLKSLARVETIREQLKELPSGPADAARICRELLADLDRLEGALVAKAVAEVKGILQIYIARIEYDPDTNKARVGFYRGPFFDGPVPPGGGGSGKPQNSGICTLAGGGFAPPTTEEKIPFRRQVAPAILRRIVPPLECWR